ncbi:MAG: ABC transporter substrate-binding protein [Planctomycetota bacterium]|nr:ABC transporter substrate-binding protein [Planctomycetota bacterium]
MMGFTTIRRGVVALGVVSVVLAAAFQPARADEARPLTMRFGWLPEAHEAGFWVALEKGYYRDEGLAVELRPGGKDPNSPIKEVAAGTTDVGEVGGIEQVVAAVAGGKAIRAFAAIHRETPQALLSLESAPVKSAQDLVGKTVAVPDGDAAEILLKALIKKNNIAPASVKCVPFTYDVDPLTKGAVSVVCGFSTDEALQIEAKGSKLVVWSYASMGVQSYGYTLFCSPETIAKRGRDIAAFVKASRRGWQYVFENPGESVKIMAKRFPGTLEEAVEKRKIERMKALMLAADGKLAGWELDKERVAKVIAYLKDNGQVETAPTVEQIIAPELGK